MSVSNRLNQPILVISLCRFVFLFTACAKNTEIDMPQAKPNKAHPNVVIFYIDDLGYGGIRV
ncbi:MAG: hypothetical protein ACJAVV_002096 [Alphaproteobacteria bacterium]|jgi:hypothetical protein